MDPNGASYRYTILILNCLLTFGSYFCFDMPSNLQQHIEDSVISSWGGSNVDFYYNLFYTIYAWTNMVMSLVAGVMVDRLGKTRSMYFFIGLCLTGASLYALGATLVGIDDRARYGIMFFGRFVFGLGGGSITIVQNAISAQWFSGKELAMVEITPAFLSAVRSFLFFFVQFSGSRP